MFYAVAHHGTAGLGYSYGYAELWEGSEPPRADMTTTVAGPFATKDEAEQEIETMNRECDIFRDRSDN